MDNVTDSSGVFVILTIKSGMKIWQDRNFASLTTAQIANAARWRKFRPCSCNDSLIQPARDINCKSCMNLDVKQNVHNLKLLVWCFQKFQLILMNLEIGCYFDTSPYYLIKQLNIMYYALFLQQRLYYIIIEEERVRDRYFALAMSENRDRTLESLLEMFLETQLD